MTPEAIAERLDGRRTGPGRWMAKCPGHSDRTASLSIFQGRKGVVLHCFAGCDTRAILAAAGLQWADLFNGPPPTPQQIEAVKRERAARAAVRNARRRQERLLVDKLRKLESIRNQLGAKLISIADVPEGDEVARLFHNVCDRHRIAHTELEQFQERK